MITLKLPDSYSSIDFDEGAGVEVCQKKWPAGDVKDTTKRRLFAAGLLQMQQPVILSTTYDEVGNNVGVRLVWKIERRLAEDITRSVIFYPVSGACWQPHFKGRTMMLSGNYNGWRLEDAWLDK